MHGTTPTVSLPRIVGGEDHWCIILESWGLGRHHTIGVGGCEGRLLYLVLLFLVRRSSNIVNYL